MVKLQFRENASFFLPGQAGKLCVGFLLEHFGANHSHRIGVKRPTFSGLVPQD